VLSPFRNLLPLALLEGGRPGASVEGEDNSLIVTMLDHKRKRTAGVFVRRNQRCELAIRLFFPFLDFFR